MKKVIMFMAILTGCVLEKYKGDFKFRHKGDRSRKEDIKNLEEKLGSASLYDDVSMLREALDKGEIDYSEAMAKAIKLEKREVVDLIFEKKVGIYDKNIVDLMLKEKRNIVGRLKTNNSKGFNDLIAIYAALKGHIKMLELMLEKGASDFDGAMRAAAKRGHIEIVELMLRKGASDFDGAMREAARRRHLEIVKLMLDRGATNYNGVMVGAAKVGHIEIVDLMIKKGARNYSMAMELAAKVGHIEIVELLMKKGLNIDYNKAMGEAAYGGHREIVELMMKKGANDYDVAMIRAAAGDKREMVELMIEKGAISYNGAMRLGDMAIQRFILSVFWEQIDEKYLDKHARNEMLKINNGIKYPVSGYGYEQGFLLSNVVDGRKGDEEYLFVSYGTLPDEMVEKIFKYLNMRCRIELLFLYSGRDLSEEELKNIEENEWNGYMPINVKDEVGLTMLHKLCYYGHKNKVNFLVKKGVLKNMENREGRTPLWYAIKGSKDGKYENDKKFMIWIDELRKSGFRDSRI